MDDEYDENSGEESVDPAELNLDPIELHLCKGNILVWNPNEVKLLRETHHIVGALVGSLPRSPRQNAQLALPLQLMPEEAAVLMDYDVAKLVNVKTTKRTARDVVAFEEARQRSFREQQALWDALSQKRKEDFEQVIATGRTTKKHRRAERARLRRAEKAAPVPGSSPPSSVPREAGSALSKAPGRGVSGVADGSPVVCSSARLTDGDSASRAGNRSPNARQASEGATRNAADGIGEGPTETERGDGLLAFESRQASECALPAEDGAAAPGGEIEGDSAGAVDAATGVVAAVGSVAVPQSRASQSRTGDRQDSPTDGPEPRPAAEEGDDKAGTFKRPRDPQRYSGCLVHLMTASPATLRQEVADWPYPGSQQELLRYRVFKDLWETGYYLTSGCKFGGDFLVYPGDPFLFHSYFIAVCAPFAKTLSPLQLISYGRLGTNVKKTVVLCSVDEDDKVAYTSLRWTGIS